MSFNYVIIFISLWQNLSALKSNLKKTTTNLSRTTKTFKKEDGLTQKNWNIKFLLMSTIKNSLVTARENGRFTKPFLGMSKPGALNSADLIIESYCFAFKLFKRLLRMESENLRLQFMMKNEKGTANCGFGAMPLNAITLKNRLYLSIKLRIIADNLRCNSSRNKMFESTHNKICQWKLSQILQS